MTKEWTTRTDPEVSQRFGASEIHTVCFAPIGWPGRGPTIGLMIPECELHFCLMCADGEPITYVNRPPENKDIHHWVNYICRTATEHQLFVILNCDTAEQAEQAAKHALHKLPQHRRMALERMYRPEDRREPERLD